MIQLVHKNRRFAVMHENRLIHEKSPYLLQHAHNPVDWRPWAEQAFADAANACPDYCFPNRLEAILALQCAMEQKPRMMRKAPLLSG